jgi:hypothetical protein
MREIREFEEDPDLIERWTLPQKIAPRKMWRDFFVPPFPRQVGQAMTSFGTQSIIFGPLTSGAAKNLAHRFADPFQTLGKTELREQQRVVFRSGGKTSESRTISPPHVA